MSTHPDFRHLFRIALAYIGIWCGMAFFVASQMYRNQVAYGNGFLLRWDEYLSFQLASAFLWAFFTPMVVAFAERLSFQRHAVRDMTILVVAVPVLATVTVDIRRDRDRLRIEVADDGPGAAPDQLFAGRGLGRSNTRRRLQCLFKDAFDFDFLREDGRFIVRMIIAARVAAAPPREGTLLYSQPLE